MDTTHLWRGGVGVLITYMWSGGVVSVWADTAPHLWRGGICVVISITDPIKVCDCFTNNPSKQLLEK